jgi:hypothetical protein
VPGILSTPPTATNSATSLVIETTPAASATATATTLSLGEEDQDYQKQQHESVKKLHSDSYEAAIQNLCDNGSSSSIICGANNYNNNEQQKSSPNLIVDVDLNQEANLNLLYKKQEANFYIQQFLTNLLALGVLEYESGFENAINKTFKV